MRHIGIDARLTYYRTGGISTYIVRLIDALAQIDAINRYTVLQSRKQRGALTPHMRCAPLWTPAHHRIERLALSLELARFNFDVLHTTDFIPPYRGAKRHVITVHDLNFLHYPQFLTPESRRYYNDQINYAVKHADHILTISTASKHDLINMLNVPSDKITVHLLGVDEAFQPLAEPVIAHYRRVLDLPEHYLLFVGTFEPRKNIAGLCEAYADLRRDLPDAPPLVLAGKPGWNFEETRARIAALNIDDHLLWREAVSQDALPALYNGALALITPSFYEGFGFPALEAMACGTVPIVSNRSSLPEVVGDVGLQVTPEDRAAITQAMRHAISADDWRAQQREAGLRRAALFRWEDTARAALSVYQSVV